MTLTRSNANTNGSLSSARTRNAFISSIVPQLGSALGRSLATAIKNINLQGGDTTPTSKRDNRGQNTGRNRRNRRRSNQGQQSGWNSYGWTGTNTALVYSPTLKRLRHQFKGSTGVQNGATAGTSGGNFILGSDGNVPGSVVSFLTLQDRTVISAFTYFKIYRVRIRFLPALGTGASGIVALGYADNTSITTPTVANDVTGLVSSFVGSVWNTLELDVRPVNQYDEYYINEPSKDAEHRRPGSIKFFSTNSGAAWALVGYIDVTLDMEVF